MSFPNQKNVTMQIRRFFTKNVLFLGNRWVFLPEDFAEYSRIYMQDEQHFMQKLPECIFEKNKIHTVNRFRIV